MPLVSLLFFVIVIEGYVVLSSELLAIRLTTPFIGSGADTVSVIISAVLLPLAAGYYAGGRFRLKNGYQSVRKRLSRNILIAACFLIPGLSFILIELWFYAAMTFGITNRVLLITLYCLIFIVTPVYALGQTVPLVSHYFSRQRLAHITGRMLFFSTLGSFAGAVLSTLLIMNVFGVHYAVICVYVLLLILGFALAKNRFGPSMITMFILTAIGIYLNSDTQLEHRNIVSNNAYNTIIVNDDGAGRQMIMNNNASSRLGHDGKRYGYVDFVEETFLDPLREKDAPKHDILVVGAAGFTFGLSDLDNNYTFVDIDPAVKTVAERDFLKMELSPNKTFVPEDARSYLTRHPQQKYDLIFLDAFLGDLNIPEQLVTQQFFMQVHDALKPGGIVTANFVVSPTFSSKFSRHLDNTLRSVFPNAGRQVLAPFNGWNDDPNMLGNVIYYAKKQDEIGAKQTIYTDDRNTMSFDKPGKASMSRFVGKEAEGK
jgi:hypothetical protein